MIWTTLRQRYIVAFVHKFHYRITFKKIKHNTAEQQFDKYSGKKLKKTILKTQVQDIRIEPWDVQDNLPKHL